MSCCTAIEARRRQGITNKKGKGEARPSRGICIGGGGCVVRRGNGLLGSCMIKTALTLTGEQLERIAHYVRHRIEGIEAARSHGTAER